MTVVPTSPSVPSAMPTRLAPGPPNPADQTAIDWLLASAEPGIRRQARRDLLGADGAEEDAEIERGPKASLLLSGQHEDGSFGGHPYAKWTGAHWRLVSLIELGLPAGHPQAIVAAQTVLDWLTSRGHRAHVPMRAGPVSCCCSTRYSSRTAAARSAILSGCSYATRRTGATTSCRVCSCSLGLAHCLMHGPTKPWHSCAAGSEGTAPGTCRADRCGGPQAARTGRSSAGADRGAAKCSP